MLLNLSNHPSADWPSIQSSYAKGQYEHVLDYAFPEINPEWDGNAIKQFAVELLPNILAFKPTVVHIMGEMTFTFTMVRFLQRQGVRCIASTTRRMVIENENGSRTYTFEFVRFRDYPVL